MVSSAALLPSATIAANVATQPRRNENSHCTHQLLADALAMRSNGRSAPGVVSTLTSRGLTDVEAHKALSAIDRQLGLSRTMTRRVQTLVVASITVQLLLALVMASLSIAAAPIPAFIALAIVARACRADRSTLQQLSRQQHLFG